jgi:hypothetical protein
MSAADTSDPLVGAGFETIYRQQVEPELQRLEAERGKAMRLAWLIWFAGAALFGVECLATSLITSGRHWWPPELLFWITVIGTIAFGYAPLAVVASNAKTKVISTLCAPLGVKFQMKGFEAPAFDRLTSLNLLPKPDDKTFEDFFWGSRGTSDFSLYEATLTRGSGKNRRTVFRGQIFRVEFPRKFLGTTVVLRDSGWLNAFECPKGLEKVGLEDPHFEKIFQVFGDDQVEARAILTPTFMEHLVALEQAYAGENLRCGFEAGHLLIAIETPDHFEIGGMFSSLVDKKRVERIAGDLRAVFNLIDAFVESPR